MLTELPEDILVLIARFLDAKSLCALRLCCHALKEVADLDFIWANLFTEMFLPPQPSIQISSNNIFFAPATTTGNAEKIVSWKTKVQKWSAIRPQPFVAPALRLAANGPGGILKPPHRFVHRGDQIGDHFFFFGGKGFNERFNDVWSINLSGVPLVVKQHLCAGDKPPPRGSPAVAAIGTTLYAFGGEGPMSDFRNDLWALVMSPGPGEGAGCPRIP
eukprot:Rmarinus@m.22597